MITIKCNNCHIKSNYLDSEVITRCDFCSSDDIKQDSLKVTIEYLKEHKIIEVSK